MISTPARTAWPVQMILALLHPPLLPSSLLPRALILLVLPLLTGCGAEEGMEGPDFLLREVDGVVVAENAGLHMADTLAWTVDTAAAVTIGVLEGQEEYVFGRIGGMALTPERHILVADRLANELRVFDREGRFLRRVGRKGEGPGEFQGITQLRWLVGDTLAVINQPGQRVDLLDPDLRFVRRYQPRLTETVAPSGMTADKLETVFDDGLPLMSDFMGVCRSGTGTMCADSILLYRTGETGEILTRFGVFVWARTESHQVRPGTSAAWGEPHPQTFWTTHGNRLYYGDAQRFEILVYGPDGALERRVRVNEPAPRFGRDQVFPPAPPPEPTGNQKMDEVLRVFHEVRQTAELPETFPSFSDLIVDQEGNVWVREYQPPAETDVPARWFIFDAQGQLRWAIRSPPGLKRSPDPVGSLDPYIGTDRIVVSVRDDYDVESVVVYPLRKR